MKPKVLLDQELRRKVVSSRIAGCSYEQIAEMCNISKTTAHSIVTRTFAQRCDELREEVDQLRALMMARLDALTVALWGTRSDPATASVIIKIIERQSKLFGLDAPVKLDASGLPDLALQVNVMTAESQFESALRALKMAKELGVRLPTEIDAHGEASQVPVANVLRFPPHKRNDPREEPKDPE